MSERAALHVLRLLQHGDSQFPTGGFAFSSGLEGMLADGTTASADLERSITSMLRCRWAAFDRQVLRRAFAADDDWAALAALDAAIEAALLAPVERLGSVRAGSALLTTHVRLGTPRADQMRSRIASGVLRGHRLVVEGCMWRALGLDEEDALLLSAYAYTNGLCTAAVRLGRLGALTQQRLLAGLLPLMAALVSTPDEAPPRAFNPMAEIAMMRHPERTQNLFAT